MHASAHVCHFHSPNRPSCSSDHRHPPPQSLEQVPRQFGRHWVRRLGEPDVPAKSDVLESLKIMTHMTRPWHDLLPRSRFRPKTGSFKEAFLCFSWGPVKKVLGFWNPRVTYFSWTFRLQDLWVPVTYYIGRCSIVVSKSLPMNFGRIPPKMGGSGEIPQGRCLMGQANWWPFCRQIVTAPCRAVTPRHHAASHIFVGDRSQDKGTFATLMNHL